jgi:poly(3-hydroxybutyrate) depolymerase
MTHRLACDRADLFAAGVSFAGAVLTSCDPSTTVGMMQIHGTKDESVLYEGEGDMQPGAEKTIAIWAAKNHCAEKASEAGSLDVDPAGKGQETKVTRHEGCRDNGGAELWRVEEGPHVFAFTPEALERIWQFLEAHAKR